MTTRFRRIYFEHFHAARCKSRCAQIKQHKELAEQYDREARSVFSQFCESIYQEWIERSQERMEKPPGKDYTHEDYSRALANFMNTYLQEHRLTAMELSKISGVSLASITLMRISNGKFVKEDVAKVSEVLGVPLGPRTMLEYGKLIGLFEQPKKKRGRPPKYGPYPD